VAMLYAIMSLHHTYPGEYVTDVRVPYGPIFQHNNKIVDIADNDTEAIINLGYPEINRSNQTCVSFMNGMVHDLAIKLNRPINKANINGFMPIGPQEISWYSAVYQDLGKDVPYWVVDAGYKKDFTAKFWGTANYQAIVDAFPDTIFVQIGDINHVHPPLIGKNVLNYVGKTDLRQLIRLIFNSYGVITPVSLPMVLSTAIPAHSRFNRPLRHCIVISGGREPNQYQQLPGHQFFHTIGQLDCCASGGCWLSRTMPIGDGDAKDTDSLCKKPVFYKDQYIPQCLKNIDPLEVITTMRKLL
jgi:hypothetical protein